MYLLTTSQRLYMGVSENNGTPKSSILIGFSIINHPFWGTTIFGTTHIDSTVELQTFGATERHGSLFSPNPYQVSNPNLATKPSIDLYVHIWTPSSQYRGFILGNSCIFFDWSRLNPLNSKPFVLPLNRHFLSGNTKKLIRPWKIWMMGRPVLSFSWIFATFLRMFFNNCHSLYFLLLDFCHPLVHTFAFCKTYIPIWQPKQNSREKYPCKFCLHGPETKNKWFVLSSNFLHRGRCRVC